ncbi:chorismate synthase [Senegalia massiliensis]|uniref:Chorismate synthase n=1 Tax=Senegalia massiliensis TaxID=1720316 RepID=A0A845R2I4_9CLOT|nr:chorismate synthase [Senegalia massiliensis]
MLRFLTAGESHGKGLIGIIDGIPSNLKIDIDFINMELKRRQKGYGRGNRMKIESDEINILSGVRGGITTGSPLTFFIENKDYKNWIDKMHIEKSIKESITKPRPGHADFAGSIKYNQKDLRNILERSSARETAMRVAIGSVAKLILKQFGINIYSYITSIGNLVDEQKYDINKIKTSDDSIMRVLNKGLEEKIIRMIDKTKEVGDTLGGSFKLLATNIPIGLGSHAQWDKKLDSKLTGAIMSLQGIKAIEIGTGINSSKNVGSNVHDEIFYNGSYYRKTNNAGGIEGGISNGENIEIKAYMKPIPSLRIPLQSVDMDTKEKVSAHKERADVCAVPSASIVGESILAWTLVEELFIKFGGDSIDEIKVNYYNYINN